MHYCDYIYWGSGCSRWVDFKSANVLVSIHSLKTMNLDPLRGLGPFFLRNRTILGHSPIRKGQACRLATTYDVFFKHWHCVWWKHWCCDAFTFLYFACTILFKASALSYKLLFYYVTVFKKHLSHHSSFTLFECHAGFICMGFGEL